MKTHIEPSTVNSVLQDKNEMFIIKDNITVYLLKKEHIIIIEKIWRQLEISNKDVGLTCRWDWVKTWIDHYEDVVNYWFVAGVQNNIPCGIALVTKETNRKLPLSVKSFHIGTSGEPYQDMVRMINNTLLTTPESKEIFYSALIEIISTYFQWEEIVCDDFSSEDALVVQKIITKNPHRFTIEKNTCRYFDFANLKENKKNVLSNLSSTARYKIKRSLKEFGNDVTGEWAENVADAYDIFDEMAALFQTRWNKQGQRGIFASHRYIAFHRALIKKLLPENRIILFRVKSKQYGTLGCLYLLIDNNVAYGYQLGLNDFSNVTFPTLKSRRLKVGFIVHTLCMEECLTRGITAYNFSIGEYPYKMEITNAENEVVTISLQRNRRPYIRNNIIKMHTFFMENKKMSLLLKPIQIIRSISGSK